MTPVSHRPQSLTEVVEEFFDTKLAEVTGFEVRPSQREMALAIAEAMTNNQRLAVEAETGTGKSLAYLVPLLLRESAQDRPAVIATKTLQLQDQLLRKELPLLQALLPAPRKIVQARGWSNYLCLRKIETPGEELTRDLGAELPYLRNLSAERQGRLTRQDVNLAQNRWSKVQADPLDCQKQSCPHFSKCGLFAERRELETADLILTNHAFLLSDLKVRRDGGGLLPACDVLVIDEAHRLDDVATDHLSVVVDAERFFSVLSSPLQGWLGAVRFAFLAHLPDAHLLEWSDRFDRVVLLALKDLEILAAEVLTELRLLRPAQSTPSTVAHEILIGPSGERVANLASEFCYSLEATVGELLALSAEYDDISAAVAPPELVRLARSLQNLARDLEFLLQGQDPDWVFLCELAPPRFLARPIDNSLALDSELFATFSTVVATSASLKVNDSFDFFLSRTGLSLNPTLEMSLASPFDPASMSFLGLLDDGLDPNHPDFPKSLAPALVALTVGLAGRTLILTTSHRRIGEFAQLLASDLASEGVELLVQGQAPPSQLLRRFSSSGRQVLLGVDTFWEGVDIPGERLSCVVLTKLPFPVPTDPLFAARCRRIEERGGRAFEELSLPLTALKLKQGFGRLLRGAGDRGIFLLLDPRVSQKRYGRALLRQLPTERAVRSDIDDLVDQALTWAETNLTTGTP